MAMDEVEIEARAAATAFIEIAAFIERADLDDAARSIRAGLETALDDDERAIRIRALHLIEEARERYRGAQLGVMIRPD